ncbi:hypothetical protein bpmyx0001_25560 [Bacillus pseudomycoides DSM 12442]|nr:hypothetical protein bpmyx0001_25560 [Bacillus pseudomycoides DSM 12442]
MEVVTMSVNVEQVRLANDDETYRKLNIHPTEPQPKEDGMRTDGREGSFEWWYTDAEFEDGTTVVTTFYTKNHFDVLGPAWPTVQIDITYPDGTKILMSSQEAKGSRLNAKKDICDVNINKSYLKYQDGQYILHFEEGYIKYHATMTSKLPMWRPNTGHWFYGDQDEHFFAWFIAQPSATIEATLTIGDKMIQLNGTGYHDHNWGNIGMEKLMNHWYWGRAKVDGFDIIACDIIAEKNYNYKRLPVFMLAKDGKIISDDQSLTKIQREDIIEHPETKKFMDNHLIYLQPISSFESYTVEFIRNRDIVSISLLDNLDSTQALIAKKSGANPTYTRILGDVHLTHELNGVKKNYKAEGLWDQMFFGNNKYAIINN